jgi:hypothetical protein
MVPRQGRPLQSWKTFLCNHGKNIASIDLIVVPTIAFRRLSLGQQLGHIMRENGVPCLRRVDAVPEQILVGIPADEWRILWADAGVDHVGQTKGCWIGDDRV